ncbi:MAG: type II toxin-antitoxin system VapC family toxin [Oscillospiraceae bacterium]|nr:type II toxin-antitoxin system VapC family toxin [Oscillospiraceae bacterium]
MTYALDTNIISYFVQDDSHVISRFRQALAAGNKIIIPPAAYYEIRRGFKHKNAPKKERAFNCMCTLYSIGEMNLPAWEEAADIYGKSRKAGNPIEDTDILIAAFCVVNGCVLVTNNTKHFEGIDGLQMVNWSE